MGDALYAPIPLLYDAGHALVAWVRQSETAVCWILILAAVLL